MQESGVHVVSRVSSAGRTHEAEVYYSLWDGLMTGNDARILVLGATSELIAFLAPLTC